MLALIEVRSGGIFIPPPKKKNNSRINSFEIFYTNEKTSPEKHIKLFKLNAIEGLISYLLGEVAPINQIKDQDRNDIMENQLSIFLFDKKMTSKNIQSITERKDAIYNKKDITEVENLSLDNFLDHQFSEIIKFLKNELFLVTGKNSFPEVFNAFKKEYLEYYEIINKKIKNKDMSFLNSISLTEKDYIKIPKKCSSKGINLIDKINNKIEKFIDCYNKNKAPDKITDIPFFPLNIALIKEIKKSINKKTLDFTKLNSSKWSCFDNSIGKNKHWIEASYIPHVTISTGFILKYNFNIYIKNLTESQINRFKNGPRIARWAEGGIAILNLCDTSPPASAYFDHRSVSMKFSDLQYYTGYYYK